LAGSAKDSAGNITKGGIWNFKTGNFGTGFEMLLG